MSKRNRVVWRFASVICILALICASAGCSASEGAGSNRGRYVTGLGYIYQPEEIHIDSLIAQEDYDYPPPLESAVGITADADIRGGMGYIQIGLKAKKDAFEDIESMNICFVIDISGSMADYDKLSWVKNAFYIFINNVRKNDIISVVIFDDKTEVLVPPTAIKDENDRDQFKRKVDSLRPRGSTDVLKGINLGYEQVGQNYGESYINRVILLTDGMHNGSGTKDDILDAVSQNNAQGINISTIALGSSADIDLMVDMAVTGGGSSRFISDYDQMEQAFGSELDRLVVPAARSVSIKLALSEGVSLKETWGYKYWTQDNTVRYSLDTIHNGDYETLFAVINFDKTPDKDTKIAKLTVSYVEIDGTKCEEIHDIYLSGESLADLDNIVNPRVKRAEGFVAYGKALIEIAELYNTFTNLQQSYKHSSSLSVKDDLVGLLSNGLNMTISIIDYLKEVNASLSGDWYQDALTTLDNYETMFTELYDGYMGE